MYKSSDAKIMFEKQRILMMDYEHCNALLLMDSSLDKSPLHHRQQYIAALIMIIQGCYKQLSQTEADLIHQKIVLGWDWAQINKAYSDRWGKENTKTQRTYQMILSKALKTVAGDMNKQTNIPWYTILNYRRE